MKERDSSRGHRRISPVNYYTNLIIEILKRKGMRDRFKVILGGASVTEEWINKIGLRRLGEGGYAGDAVEAIKLVKRLLGEGE
ncbi:MAG: hypothetical protein QXR65_08330 [Candidatus Bathyarchaeia archaeon]